MPLFKTEDKNFKNLNYFPKRTTREVEPEPFTNLRTIKNSKRNTKISLDTFVQNRESTPVSPLPQ